MAVALTLGMRRFLFVIALMIGCSGSEPTLDRPTASLSRRPPARPDAITRGGERRWFVMKQVQLGTQSATGQIDGSAWKGLGFDLDRRATTVTESPVSANSCRRRAGSHPRVLVDGLEGIDNNFGKELMPIIRSVKSDVEAVANAEIASGGYTLMLRVDGAVAGDNASAPGALYAVGPHVGAPTFTSDDRWPVWSSTLVDGIDLDEPVRRFPLGYVRNGTWVSGEIGEGPEPIWIPIFGVVPMHASALLAVDLASGHGVLAGALPNVELERMLEAWAGQYGICRGHETFDTLVEILGASADVVVGAPDLQSTTRECDAISLGIGFDVVPVSAPTVVVPPPPGPTTCASAGP